MVAFLISKLEYITDAYSITQFQIIFLKAHLIYYHLFLFLFINILDNHYYYYSKDFFTVDTMFFFVIFCWRHCLFLARKYLCCVFFFTCSFCIHSRMNVVLSDDSKELLTVIQNGKDRLFWRTWNDLAIKVLSRSFLKIFFLFFSFLLLFLFSKPWLAF